MTINGPKKIYYKIGEVAKLADVPTHVLRYWESEFACITPKRTRSDQRLYREGDVSAILQIKELLHLRGYTIAGARKYLQGEETDVSDSTIGAKTNTKSLAHFFSIKQEIIDLQKILKKSL